MKMKKIVLVAFVLIVVSLTCLISFLKPIESQVVPSYEETAPASMVEMCANISAWGGNMTAWNESCADLAFLQKGKVLPIAIQSAGNLTQERLRKE
jgi:hypothetical protein